MRMLAVRAKCEMAGMSADRHRHRQIGNMNTRIN